MSASDANAKDRPSRAGAFNPELTPAEFETEFWGRVLERQPFYEDVLRRQAEGLARIGRYGELLPLDRRLIEMHPQDPVLHYNLCCTLSRLGQLVDAIAELRQAVRLGYDDFAHIDTDPDLDPLRDFPEFKLAVKPKRAKRKK